MSNQKENLNRKHHREFKCLNDRTITSHLLGLVAGAGVAKVAAHLGADVLQRSLTTGALLDAVAVGLLGLVVGGT
jgi:hypothetical protein